MPQARYARGMGDSLVIPSNIPWRELKAEVLEELIYWLLHDLGFRDITWRKGGVGGGASDGGRDIEAMFHVQIGTGIIQSQKWWFEAKGRTGTVEPSEVKDTITNIAARPD